MWPKYLLFTLHLALIHHQASADNITNTETKIATFDNGFNITRPSANFTVLTTYKFTGCNTTEQSRLSDAVWKATQIADNGYRVENYDGISWPSMDWNSQAVIEYFGPPDKNKALREKIIMTLFRASYAYPGWGWADWWNDNYVQLRCDKPDPNDKNAECNDDPPFPAYFDKKAKEYGYPLIAFCPVYFSKLPTHDEAWKIIEANKNGERSNVANMRTQATTMLHEWIHMNWGVAQIHPGNAIDHWMTIGPHDAREKVKAYKAGRAKLLATQDVAKAADNNDNYVYYAQAKLMEHKFGHYPEFPMAWSPDRSRKVNEDIDKGRPGAPQSLTANLDDLDGEDPDDADADTPTDSPQYDVKDYPEWYQPIISAIYAKNKATNTASLTLSSVSQPSPVAQNTSMLVTVERASTTLTTVIPAGQVSTVPAAEPATTKSALSTSSGLFDQPVPTKSALTTSIGIFDKPATMTTALSTSSDIFG